MVRDPRVIAAWFRAQQVCRVGFCHAGRPYVIPMYYGYRAETIFLHTGGTGQKLAYLAVNPRVCIEVDNGGHVVPADRACAFTGQYWSIVAHGHARILQDAVKRRAGLDIIMEHLTGRGKWDYAPGALAKVVVVEVRLEEVTARQSEGTASTGSSR